MRGRARHQAIDHACAHEQQRIGAIDGRIEIAELFESELCLDRLKGVRQCAEGEMAPRCGLRPEPCNQVGLCKRSQFTQGANAPDRESFSVFFIEAEKGDGQFRQARGFLALGNHGDSARDSGFEPGGMEVGADRD